MKTLKLFLIASLISASLYSQTNFQGGIYSNTVWTKLNSPYIITGDVVLFPGKSLTIQPGVEIKFNGYYFLEIRGILISIGLDTSKIIFTSNLSNPQKGNWVGVKIKNNQGAKASFEYCDFSYSESATNVECCWQGGPIYFKHCKFENNSSAMTGYTGDVINVDSCEFLQNTYCITQADRKITNSRFINNEYGLYFTERISVNNSIFSDNMTALYGGRGVVENCTINNNHIGIQSFFEGFEVKNNTINNNDTALMLSNYDGHYPPVKNNHICNNGFNVINMDDINKDLTQNCWCSTDSTYIEGKLVDGYDNIYLGLFNYDIYDDSCQTILRTVTKVNLAGIYQADASRYIQLYPNPFQSNLNVEFKSSQINEVSISIYNIYGQEVYTNTQLDNPINLSLNYLDDGLYFCTIKAGAMVINKKIIKTR